MLPLRRVDVRILSYRIREMQLFHLFFLKKDKKNNSQRLWPWWNKAIHGKIITKSQLIFRYAMSETGKKNERQFIRPDLRYDETWTVAYSFPDNTQYNHHTAYGHANTEAKFNRILLRWCNIIKTVTTQRTELKPYNVCSYTELHTL